MIRATLIRALVKIANALSPGGHAYYSTACQHGRHGACGAGQRARGEHGAPHCKHCSSVCICPECRHA